jgi:hypothetical protein
MAEAISGALALVVVIVGGSLFLALLVCAYLVPVNILRIARHLGGIREQLTRIAAAAERQSPGGVDEFRELELARRRRASSDVPAV